MAENYITCPDEKGSINISEDVIVTMVRAAINEIDGVAGLGNQSGADLAERLRLKPAEKGLKVEFEEGKISVDTILTVRYGCNIVDVARQVQDAVTTAVESMTGLGTPNVNVHVAGVAFER